MLRWLVVHLSQETGISNEASRAYAFWSGFGSCLGYASVAAVAWRHLKCHSRGCRRIGRHPVEGTPFKVCRRCHPTLSDQAPTRDEIHAALRRTHR